MLSGCFVVWLFCCLVDCIVYTFNKITKQLNNKTTKPQLSIILESRLWSFPVGTNIHHYQQQQDGDEDQGGERTQLWSQSALPGIRVDVGGESLKSVAAFGEECHGKVVDRHGEGENKATYHAWQQLRNHHLTQCLHRSSTEIESRLVDILKSATL